MQSIEYTVRLQRVLVMNQRRYKYGNCDLTVRVVYYFTPCLLSLAQEPSDDGTDAEAVPLHIRRPIRGSHHDLQCRGSRSQG